ncbi:MAG TPA: M48 family metallopeptidase, partial [Actinomycetota bacterium]|nr:M48 family metallopeptidase [Actinomycetota bacterium]
MYERIASNIRKSWALIIVFVLFVAAIGWVFGYLTDFGLWGLVGALVFSLLMVWGSYFSSDKIALAMSRAKPAEGPAFQQLHNIVDGLCIAAGMPKPRVYYVEDEAPNAFATGRNPEHSAIAVTTGLLGKLNRDELQGVIAHELSHIKNRDTLVMTLAVTLVGVIVLLADWMMRALWWGAGDDDDRGGAGAIFAVLGLVLLLVSPIIAQLLQFAISRQREFLADADGVFLTRYPDGLVSALEKLRQDQTVVRSGSRATAHLWIESPIARHANEARAHAPKASWLNRMFDTHPPLEDRITALRTSALSASPAAPSAPVAP